MIIGFDAKRAAQNRTGLGNYSRFVIRILKDRMQECHLYIPNPQKTAALGTLKDVKGITLHYPTTLFGRIFRSLWRVWGVSSDLRRDGIQLYHGLSNELPLNIRKAGCKSIVTIHDLIFLSHPQYYKPIDRLIYNYKFCRACINADHIIAVSEYTKQQIIKYYGTKGDKISVVYQGCDPSFSVPVDDDTLQKIRLRYMLPERYVLYVGSIEERKNLMLVARALQHIDDDTVRVVAVGRPTPYLDKIKSFLHEKQLEERFLFLHDVPFVDLPALYHAASVFVYPSRIEGFGIPMLEAISAGVPAIGCTGSCLEEAGGPGSLYVDPDDAQGMADAIMSIWNDADRAAKMVEEGRRYAQRFTDEKLSASLILAYKIVDN